MDNKTQDWVWEAKQGNGISVKLETDTSYVSVINAMAIGPSQLAFYVFLGAWAIHVLAIEQLAMRYEWEIHEIWRLNVSVSWFRAKSI